MNDSIFIEVSPDPIDELFFLWGPMYVPVIPNPLLLLWPFQSHGEPFALDLLFGLNQSSSQADSTAEWRVLPLEARFAMNGQKPIAAQSAVIGEEDFSRHWTSWNGQYDFTQDSAASSLRLTHEVHAIRYEFDKSITPGDTISIYDLGLYRNGVKQVMPILTLVRKSKYVYSPILQ